MVLPDSIFQLRELDAEADFYGLLQLRAMVDVRLQKLIKIEERKEKQIELIHKLIHRRF